MIEIRPAKLGDETAIHYAHMRSIREVCIKDHGEDEIKGWGYREQGDRWTEAIKRGEVWVAEQRENIYGVGYLRVIQEEKETVAHLHALYLTPEILKTGTGHKLASLLVKKAVDANAKYITLDSSITAHEFYKKLGFVDQGPSQSVEIGGYPVTCFPMKMELGK